MTDLTKIISEKWKNVDADVKAKFDKLSVKAKEDHVQAVKDYEEKYGKIEKKRKTKTKGKGKKAVAHDDDDEDDEEEDSDEEETSKKKKAKRVKKNDK